MKRADNSCKNQSYFKAPSRGGEPSHSPLRALSAPIAPASASFEGVNVYRGYVCLWRKLEDSAIFRDTYAFHIFTYLLIIAQWKSDRYSCTFEGRKMYLEKGQAITGRYRIAKALNIPPSSVRDALQRLSEKYCCVSLKTDNKATIVTLLNWDTYQSVDSKTDINPTSTRHQPDTKQEGNKVIKKELKDVAHPSVNQIMTIITDKDEANDFFDYYTANGWKVGRNPMKDWKAAARRWQRQNEARAPKTTATPVHRVVMVNCKRCKEVLPEGEMQYHVLKHKSQDNGNLSDLAKKTAEAMK